ncbi:MAG: hypothetical protein LBE12_11655 [Planctomycetaceae bacterium]|jgi:hypothetical protein|nr:hypothetical protein [Planctomycetaceae bacterium]
MNKYILFLLVSLLNIVLGCADSNPQNRLKIEGEITLGGKPVNNGNIEFEPIGNQIERTHSGSVITNGKYSIPAAQGLSAGEYRVRISVMEEVPGSRVDNPDPMLSKVEYQDTAPPEFGNKTIQKITVEANKVNKFDFKM